MNGVSKMKDWPTRQCSYTQTAKTRGIQTVHSDVSACVQNLTDTILESGLTHAKCRLKR